MGDLKDAIRARLAEVEQAVIVLDQEEDYSTARDLLVDAIEVVHGANADEEIDETAYPYDLCERCGGDACEWCEYTGEAPY